MHDCDAPVRKRINPVHPPIHRNLAGGISRNRARVRAQNTSPQRPGHRAPHAFLADGRSTLDLFGRGFALLGFGAEAAEAAPLLEAARHRHLPLTFTAIAEPHIAALYERRFVLVRPDGHVAWRDDRIPEDAQCVIDVVRGAASR